MNQEEINAQIPPAPEGVSHVDLWYEVGGLNVKLDLLLEALPKQNDRISSLEKTRTQIYTAGALIGAAVTGVLAFAKQIVEQLTA